MAEDVEGRVDVTLTTKNLVNHVLTHVFHPVTNSWIAFLPAAGAGE